MKMSSGMFLAVFVMAELLACAYYAESVSIPSNFKLGSVSVSSLGTSVVRFTVTYGGTSKPKAHLVHFENGGIEEEIAHDHGTVIFDIEETSYDVILHLDLPDIMYILHLRPWVMAGGGTTLTETLPNVAFDLEPGRDIAYEGREDVTFNVMVMLDGFDDERTAVYYDSLKWNIFVKNDTPDDGVVFHEYNWFSGMADHTDDDDDDDDDNNDEHASDSGLLVPLRLVSPAHDQMEGFYQFQLATSKEIEGIAELNTFDRFSDSHSDGSPRLLKSVQTLTSVKFHQKDVDQDFLKDVVGFVRPESDDMGSETAYCEVHPHHSTTVCDVTCSAVGGHPSDVEIVRVNTNGVVTPLSTTVNWHWLDHRVDAKVSLLRAGAADSGEYRCRVRAGQSTAVSEMVVNVEVSLKPRIIMGLSHALRRSDGVLEARCVAEGIPAPNVFFSVGYYDIPLADVFGPHHEVIVTSLNATMTQTVLRIPDSPHSLQLSYVICEARNGSPYTSARVLDVIDV